MARGGSGGATRRAHYEQYFSVMEFFPGIVYPRGIMNTNRRNFVAALLASPTYNATAAYEAVYTMRGEAATKAAWELLKVPEVKAAVEEGKAARLKRLELTADDVLRDVALGVQADGSELVEHVLDCCRYCHGEGHKYQFTPAEYQRAVEAYIRADAERKGGPRDPLGLEFNPQGGIGYDPRRLPHDDCPECFGRGEPRVLGRDTRFLSEAGRRAYAGAKYGKHGVEILTRSRDKALDIAAKHTGVAKENVHVSDLRTVPDDELARRTALAEHKLKNGGTP